MTDKREKTKVRSANKDKSQALTHSSNEAIPQINDERCPNNVLPGDGLLTHEIFTTLVSSGVDWKPDEIPSCPEWSPHDYRCFIEGVMTDADKARFVTHSEGCESCRQGLGIVCEEIARQRDAAENERFLHRALHILDQNLIPKEGPVELVVRLCKGVMELLAFAGSVLQMPTLQPVRGEAPPVLDSAPLLLEKEFDEPPLSVQLSLRPDQEAYLRLDLSVFDREQEKFSAGLTIEMKDENEIGGRRWHAITDGDGTASLILPTPGRYRLHLITEDLLHTPLEFALFIK